MLSIGEKIVYGSSGVMQIVDIREELVGDTKHEYYVLREVNSSSASQTFVPKANKKLVESMRPLLTKDEVMDIIKRIKDIPEVEWQNDNRVRSEHFRSIIESGDREEILSLIKTVYENGKRRSEEGKKNYLADENFMRKAEKLLYSEFSVVLGIPENEVQKFIEENC